MECAIVQDGQQHKALLHSDKESANGMQIVTYAISIIIIIIIIIIFFIFYKVIHEYKLRKGTTLSTLRGASTLIGWTRWALRPSALTIIIILKKK